MSHYCWIMKWSIKHGITLKIQIYALNIFPFQYNGVNCLMQNSIMHANTSFNLLRVFLSVSFIVITLLALPLDHKSVLGMLWLLVHPITKCLPEDYVKQCSCLNCNQTCKWFKTSKQLFTGKWSGLSQLSVRKHIIWLH